MLMDYERTEHKINAHIRSVMNAMATFQNLIRHNTTVSFKIQILLVADASRLYIIKKVQT